MPFSILAAFVSTIAVLTLTVAWLKHLDDEQARRRRRWERECGL